MYDIKLKYLASVFVDADSITANAENITLLLKILNDEKLLPVSLQEPSITGGIPRIAFATPSGERQLLLLGKRFDYTRLLGAEEGENWGDFSVFCREAGEKLITALNFFQRKAHRLAAVQEGLLADFPPKEMEHIAQRLFKFPPIFAQNAPFEWDWRSAAVISRTFSNVTEPTNTIATVKRWAGKIIKKDDGEIIQSHLDRIRVDFDINTVADNVKARFEESHIREFFKEVASWHDQLSSEFFAFINGRDTNE